MQMDDFSVAAACAGNSLHNNGNVDRNGVNNLNEGVRNVNVGGETLGAYDSGSIHRVGTGGDEAGDTSLRPGNRYCVRGSDDAAKTQPGGEIAGHARQHLNLLGHAHVEIQMQLAGDNLHSFQFPRLADLPGAEIKSSFSRFDVSEVNLDVHFFGAQCANQAMRSPDAHLRHRDLFGVDLQLVGDVV